MWSTVLVFGLGGTCRCSTERAGSNSCDDELKKAEQLLQFPAFLGLRLEACGPKRPQLCQGLTVAADLRRLLATWRRMTEAGPVINYQSRRCRRSGSEALIAASFCVYNISPQQAGRRDLAISS